MSGGWTNEGQRSPERCVDDWGAALEVTDEGVGSRMRRAVLGGPQVERRGSGDIDSRGGVEERRAAAAELGTWSTS